MRSSRLPVAADGYLLSPQRGSFHCLEYLVGDVFGHVDEREVVGDLDCAEALRCDARFAGDGADEIRGSDARLAARADEETGGAGEAGGGLGRGAGRERRGGW